MMVTREDINKLRKARAWMADPKHWIKKGWGKSTDGLPLPTLASLPAHVLLERSWRSNVRQQRVGR